MKSKLEKRAIELYNKIHIDQDYNHFDDEEFQEIIEDLAFEMETENINAVFDYICEIAEQEGK